MKDLSNRTGDLKNDFNLDRLIDKVSNLIQKTSENELKHSNIKKNKVIKDSNFKEDPEMSAKVWKKNKLDMKGTVNALMSNLSKSLDTRDVMKQIKILEGKPKNKGKIMELLSPNKQSKIERKVQYDSTQKGMKRWGPAIDHINRQEIIKYGETENLNIHSTAQLATKYEPMDEFEREFDLILKNMNNKDFSLNDENNKLDEVIEPCDKIKDQAERNFVKKLKFILFQQNKENKRLKKIKSKTWRKNRRKQIQVEEEKLMSLGESEYPELVKKIKERYEEKRAKIRLMRRENARKKWAKMATRFGGKDLQKTISEQAQKQHDEKRRIEQIIKNSSEDIHESDDENSTSEDETNDHQNRIEDIRDNINQLKKFSENLSDLKFIQRSIDSQNNQLDDELLKIENENYYSEEDQDVENHFNKESDNFEKEVNNQELKKVTYEEILNAKNEVLEDLNFNNNTFDLEFKFNSNDAFNLSDSIKNTKEDQFLNNSNLSKSSEEKIKKRHILNIEDELENMAEIDLQENSNLNDNEIMKQIFVQGKDDCELEENGDLENSEEKNANIKKIVPGWGNWCSSLSDINFGLNNNIEQEKEKKSLIKPNNSIDKKITKYCISQAPYPYNSNELYESTLKHPIGLEWNTTAIHNRLIQPKIQSKIGAVIKPLVYSKHLKNIQLSDSFLEKWNQVRKCNRTKARF